MDRQRDGHRLASPTVQSEVAYDFWDVRDVEASHESPKTPEPPASIVVLATAEIVVKDTSGSYLIVTCPRYEELHGQDGSVVESGQWAPPYVVRKRSWDDQQSCSLKRMLALANEIFPEEDSRKELYEQMRRWYMGLHDPKLHSAFLEYKRSWSSSGSCRVYLIRRYWFDSSEAERGALADRELLRGFRYLPLDEDRYAESTDTYDCKDHRRTHRTFLRRPLATNLEHVLGDEDRREALRGEAIELRLDAFIDRHDGLVLVGDLARYGAMCAYLTEHLGTSQEPGWSATQLRQRIANAFATLFSRCGIAHVHTAGDGFVCGIPDHPRERDEHLERFLKAYNDFVGEVREMDAEIAADAHQTGRPAPPRLGTRLGATSGDYFFGKIGLAAATASAFDGEHVIAAARLEGALGAYIKEHDKDDNLLHAVLVSTAAQTEFAQLLPTLLTPIKEIPAAAKEFKDATAMLYRVP